VKTTIELPDELFREAKASAARRGTPLKDLFREALSEKLEREDVLAQIGDAKSWPVPPPDVPIEELDQIEAAIEKAFEQIEPEDHSWS
jgi:hypothetical protein